MIFDNEALAAAIYKKRFKERLSFRDAAKQMNISFATLCRIESSKMPDLNTYAIICDWLGCSVSKFFKKQTSKSK